MLIARFEPGFFDKAKPAITTTLRETYCKMWPKIIDKRKGWKQVLLLLLPKAGSATEYDNESPRNLYHII